MTPTCKDCLFCETIEDESFMACQATQKLVMPRSKVCDFFEEKGCMCKECTETTPDKYTNTTEQTREKKVVPQLFAAFGEPYTAEETKRVYDYVKANAPTDDSCCNANSYSKLNNFGDEDYETCDCDECTATDYDDWTQAEFFADDLDRATSEVLENLAFLGEGTTPKDVLGPILGLEATIATLKRFLLEYEEE